MATPFCSLRSRKLPIYHSHDLSGFSILKYACMLSRAIQHCHVKSKRSLPVSTNLRALGPRPGRPKGWSQSRNWGHRAHVKDLHGVPKCADIIRPAKINCKRIQPSVKTSNCSPYLQSHGFRHGTLESIKPSVIAAEPQKISMKNWPATGRV